MDTNERDREIVEREFACDNACRNFAPHHAWWCEERRRNATRLAAAVRKDERRRATESNVDALVRGHGDGQLQGVRDALAFVQKRLMVKDARWLWMDVAECLKDAMAHFGISAPATPAEREPAMVCDSCNSTVPFLTLTAGGFSLCGSCWPSPAEREEPKALVANEADNSMAMFERMSALGPLLRSDANGYACVVGMSRDPWDESEMIEREVHCGPTPAQAIEKAWLALFAQGWTPSPPCPDCGRSDGTHGHVIGCDDVKFEGENMYCAAPCCPRACTTKREED